MLSVKQIPKNFGSSLLAVQAHAHACIHGEFTPKPSFGDFGHKDFCLLFNIMEEDDTTTACGEHKKKYI